MKLSLILIGNLNANTAQFIILYQNSGYTIHMHNAHALKLFQNKIACLRFIFKKILGGFFQTHFKNIIEDDLEFF